MELRPITDDERPAFVRAVGRQFGAGVGAAQAERFSRLIELDRSIAAFDRDRIVATALSEAYEMTLPGGSAGCAGITAVGVRTDFRRRGLMTRMMRHSLDHARDRGEPLSALYASEGAIYGRFGYGPAAPTSRLRLRAGEPLLADPVDERAELVEGDVPMERLRVVFAKALERQPGMLDRSDERWDVLHGGAPEGEGPQPYYAFVGDRGYAAYRLDSGEDEEEGGTVRVTELVAADPDAQAALWQYLASVDLYPKVEAPLRPPDEPLAHRLRDPDRLQTSEHEALWLRLVDVPAALQARRYAAKGQLVIEVADEFCPDNSGRWALRGSPDEAACEPTDRSPDLSMDAAALGTVYLGGQRWATLVRARRVTEHTPGSARLADAMFASDPLPWNPRIF